MENIWAFLEQTLAATLTAAVLLIAKRLFLDKLSPPVAVRRVGHPGPADLIARRAAGQGPDA